MLVQRILDFITLLERESPSVPCDVTLRASIFTRFSQKPKDNILTSEDHQFLIGCYKSRWEVIFDSPNDYTRNPSVINQYWIDLARELEPLVTINYLKILIPTVTNERDLNSGSPLTETVNLFNFFLGHGGTTLFRKWSFFEHLQAFRFDLSTYRSIDERKLSVVTVDELTRLKLCKHTTRQVTVGTDNFANFWDFMRKKVFTRLGDYGAIPKGLLPHLLELIERFYHLKTNGTAFLLFKNEVKNFFQRMYGYELAEVNSLYGAKINYKGKEDYLLEVFVALYEAKDFFEVDDEIKFLAKWLYRYNPALNAVSKELEPLYKDVAAEGDIELEMHKNSLLTNCCTVLVSLLTTQFESSSFLPKKSYSLWDKVNTVFPESGGIFSRLLPAIAANRPDSLSLAYDKVIKDVINPMKNNPGYFSWFIHDEVTLRWLDLVQSGRFSELGAYWFDPELLVSALLLFNTSKESVRSASTLFLDELIHTYAQDQTDLMKQFRVNILFTQFLSGLDENHRLHVLRLIKLCDQNSAKSKFISNCTMYINDRLTQLYQPPLDRGAILFFSPLRKGCAKTFFFPKESHDLRAIITGYKIQLSSMDLDPRTMEKMSHFLLKIGQPILSRAQKEMAKYGDRANEYIGQYT